MKTPDPTLLELARPRRRAKTRPALMEAGLKLLAERPVDSLSIDEIVEAARVAKGSFFYHFTDKQSFAREIAGAVRDEIEATIAEVNRGVADPALRVARGIGQFVLFALEAPDKATIVVTADWRSADPRHALNAGLRADLELGLETGRFDCPDLDAAMLNLIGLTNLLIGKILFERLSAARTRPLFISVLAFAYRGLGLCVAESELLLDAVAAELLRD
jgi:AcrR family transcriptional regulator